MWSVEVARGEPRCLCAVRTTTTCSVETFYRYHIPKKYIAKESEERGGGTVAYCCIYFFTSIPVKDADRNVACRAKLEASILPSVSPQSGVNAALLGSVFLAASGGQS